MEVVGGVASVVNLVQLAAAIIQITAAIIKRVHDAPEDLKALRAQLEIVKILLKETSALQEDHNAAMISTNLRSVLQLTLQSAESFVSRLKVTYSKVTTVTGVKRQFRLASFDGAAARRKLDQLSLLEIHLVASLQLASWYASCPLTLNPDTQSNS